MFKVVPKELIRAKIEIKVPEDFGKTSKAELEVTYKKLSVSEVDELVAQGRNGTLLDDRVLHDYVVDIKGAIDADDKPIAFSSDLIDMLLDMDYAREPLVKRFFEINLGQEALRQGN